MDFSFTGEQEMFRNSVKDFMKREWSLEKVRECEDLFDESLAEDKKGYFPELYAKMAQLGWLGLPFPEEYGGMECDTTYLAIISEEMGKALFLSPFSHTVVMCGQLIAEIGSRQQKEFFLPKISKGEIILTLAMTEPGMDFISEHSKMDTYARQEERKFILRGMKIFIPYAHVSQYFLVAAKTASTPSLKNGITLFLLESQSSGTRITPLRTIGGERLYEISFQNVEIPTENILGKLNEGYNALERVLQRATLIASAHMIGSAHAALDMAVEHAKVRVQFDQPIGKFQGVSHKLADAALKVDSAKLLVYYTTWMIDQGIPSNKEVAMTKFYAYEAYRETTTQGHQILGGTGFMKEHNMQLFFRKALAVQATLGAPEIQKEVISKELGIYKPES